MAVVTPTQVIKEGRAVLFEHPQIRHDAAELLHALDALTPDDRTKVRRYLLHVYGITAGITTPQARPLADTEEWAVDRHTVAAAAGALDALAALVECGLDQEDNRARVAALATAHARALEEVAHR